MSPSGWPPAVVVEAATPRPCGTGLPDTTWTPVCSCHLGLLEWLWPQSARVSIARWLWVVSQGGGRRSPRTLPGTVLPPRSLAGASPSWHPLTPLREAARPHPPASFALLRGRLPGARVLVLCFPLTSGCTGGGSATHTAFPSPSGASGCAERRVQSPRPGQGLGSFRLASVSAPHPRVSTDPRPSQLCRSPHAAPDRDRLSQERCSALGLGFNGNRFAAPLRF